ncbi:DedA family protein [Lentzea kentuckyensis]|uniref:DedA family protein n=1 Tax=Lentzea kentuckyensis TaxID=360086 RepID=UPI000A36659B|nr:DedA family protein [Lentzea kentuckyensis]
MFTDWADTLTTLPPHTLLLVAAGLMFVETALLVGFAVPAELTLLVVGLLSYQGALPLVAGLPVCVAAGIAGDQAAYWTGRTFHARTPTSTRMARYRERAESLLRRRGGPAVFLARWIPFVRTCMPVTAGASGLSAPVFTLFAAAGVATWMSATVLIGYAAGGSLAMATTWAGRGTATVCLVVAIAAAVVIIRRRHSARKTP